MALEYVDETDLFGASCDLNDSGVAHITHTDLGTGGNVAGPLTRTSSFLLALLQKAYDEQETGITAANKAIDISVSTPIVAARGGGNVIGERYIVTIYSSAPTIYPLDPDTA